MKSEPTRTKDPAAGVAPGARSVWGGGWRARAAGEPSEPWAPVGVAPLRAVADGPSGRGASLRSQSAWTEGGDGLGWLLGAVGPASGWARRADRARCALRRPDVRFGRANQGRRYQGGTGHY